MLVIVGVLLVFVGYVGYVVYYNVHYEDIMDKQGLELVAKIDAFKKENNRLPENLGELGLKQWSDWGAYKYRGGVFYYEQKSDSTYKLEYLLDFDTNKSYNQETGKWEF